MKQKFLIFLSATCLILTSGFLLHWPQGESSLSGRPEKVITSLPVLLKIPKKHFSVKEPITLITTGDVMLGRAVNYKSVQEKNFTWMWEKTAKILRDADLVFINLESPFVENCPLTTAGMTFCANPKNIEGLQVAGIDLANLANNHIGNFGQEGIKTTISLLNQAGISPVGTEAPVFKDIKGTRFAFLGYNDFGTLAGISQAKLEKIQQEIAEARKNADLIIVAFHWGVEYTDQPTPRQKELAHLAIDSDADLVIGHHPHWIQPTEIYKDKLVIYSLGNFIFDQFWSEKTNQSMIGRFVFSKDKLINFELIPIEINSVGQPQLK